MNVLLQGVQREEGDGAGGFWGPQEERPSNNWHNKTAGLTRQNKKGNVDSE